MPTDTPGTTTMERLLQTLTGIDQEILLARLEQDPSPETAAMHLRAAWLIVNHAELFGEPVLTAAKALLVKCGSSPEPVGPVPAFVMIRITPEPGDDPAAVAAVGDSLISSIQAHGDWVVARDGHLVDVPH